MIWYVHVRWEYVISKYGSAIIAPIHLSYANKNINVRWEYVISKYGSAIIAPIHLSYSNKNINDCILIKVYRTHQTHQTDQEP